MLIENKGCQLPAPVRGCVYPACLLQIACFFKLGTEDDRGMPPTHRFPMDPEQTQSHCVRGELYLRNITQHLQVCAETRPQTRAPPGSECFPPPALLEQTEATRTGTQDPPQCTGRHWKSWTRSTTEPQLQHMEHRWFGIASGPPSPS